MIVVNCPNWLVKQYKQATTAVPIAIVYYYVEIVVCAILQNRIDEVYTHQGGKS